MSLVAYMFHAIGDISHNDWADPHYSYTEEKFREFLSRSKIVFSIVEAKKNNLQDGIIVTFDDGHISNYNAAKIIFDNNYGCADFFINPDKVGDENYMSWSQIRELSAMGMSIQSHGLDHQYLSDCSDDELLRQLKQSKLIIEKKIGNKVTILAPPGGRYDMRTSRMAKTLGYVCIANSQPGSISCIDSFIIPRFAVLKTYCVKSIMSTSKNISFISVRLRMKYLSLKFVKSLLGNTNYDSIRNLLVRYL